MSAVLEVMQEERAQSHLPIARVVSVSFEVAGQNTDRFARRFFSVNAEPLRNNTFDRTPFEAYVVG